MRDRFKAATSTAILDAAEEIVAEQGIARASLQSVAERAGVAVGTIYNYFADRDELFQALFQRRRSEIISAIEAAAKASVKATFEAQLSSFVRAILAAFDERRRFLRIALEADQMHGKVGSHEKTVLQVSRERAAQIVQAGLRARVLQPDAADLYPLILLSMIKGVLLARLEDDKPFSDDADRLVQLFLHGSAR